MAVGGMDAPGSRYYNRISIIHYTHVKLCTQPTESQHNTNSTSQLLYYR